MILLGLMVMLLWFYFQRIDDCDILMRAERLLHKEQRDKAPSLAALVRATDDLTAASGRLNDLRAVAASAQDGQAAMANALASAEREAERYRREYERLRALDREGAAAVRAGLARIRLALEARKNGGDGSLASVVPTVARQLRVAAITETPDIDEFLVRAEAEAERAAEEEFGPNRAERR